MADTGDYNVGAATTESEMQEAFNLFDRTGSGKLRIDNLDTLVRACGLTPSDLQISNFKKEIDTANTQEFDFHQLQALVQEHRSDAVITPAQVVEAFQVFDRDGKGTISVEELKSHMANLGERLNEDEVNSMIADADPNSTGEVDYAAFVNLMSAGLA